MTGARFTVDVEWEFVSGKFAPRETIVEEILNEIGNADPGDISADEGEYAVASWNVEEEYLAPPLSKKKLIEKLMPACAVLGITDKRKIEQFVDLYQASGGRIS